VNPITPKRRKTANCVTLPMGDEKLEKLLNRNGNGELADLVREARRRGELAASLARILPAELAGDIVAANVRDGGELVVVCRSPARAARIRYAIEALLGAARAAGEEVSRLTVRVSRSD
jgi:hypothetical protein